MRLGGALNCALQRSLRTEYTSFYGRENHRCALARGACSICGARLPAAPGLTNSNAQLGLPHGCCRPQDAPEPGRDTGLVLEDDLQIHGKDRVRGIDGYGQLA